MLNVKSSCLILFCFMCWLNSITAQIIEWTSISQPNWNGSFPTQPTFESKDYGTMYSEYWSALDLYHNDTIAFTIEIITIPGLVKEQNCYQNPGCITNYFDRGIKGTLKNNDFQLVDSSASVTFTNYAYKTFKVYNKKQSMLTRGKIYIKNDVVYLLQAVGRKNAFHQERTSYFFDHFRLVQ